eukprot:gene2580-3349_t
MEKCSMCVQRIQAGKLVAKKEGRRPKDGEVTTSCQTACSVNAISFGDYNDETSLVFSMRADERSYALLEEVGTEPNVFYQVKVRNVDEAYDHMEHAAAGHEGGEHEKQGEGGDKGNGAHGEAKPAEHAH